VNPVDMDNLIADKIQKEIKDIDGIKKITSYSSVGVASLTVELFN
jgi:multidrug efflux pump subunit AcrB